MALVRLTTGLVGGRSDVGWRGAPPGARATSRSWRSVPPGATRRPPHQALLHANRSGSLVHLLLLPQPTVEAVVDVVAPRPGPNGGG